MRGSPQLPLYICARLCVARRNKALIALSYSSLGQTCTWHLPLVPPLELRAVAQAACAGAMLGWCSMGGGDLCGVQT